MKKLENKVEPAKQEAERSAQAERVRELISTPAGNGGPRVRYWRCRWCTQDGYGGGQPDHEKAMHKELYRNNKRPVGRPKGAKTRNMYQASKMEPYEEMIRRVRAKMNDAK